MSGTSKGGAKAAKTRGYHSLSQAGKKGAEARSHESRVEGGKKAAAKIGHEKLSEAGRKGAEARLRMRFLRDKDKFVAKNDHDQSNEVNYVNNQHSHDKESTNKK